MSALSFLRSAYLAAPLMLLAAAANAQAWSTAVDISATDWGGDKLIPDLAIDRDGNAIAVWKFNQTIQSARYNSATDTWSVPVYISDTENQFYTSDPKVAVENDGNATAVWTEYVGFNAVHGARYDVTTNTWSAPVELSTIGGSSYYPQVAVDGDGNAIVVWNRLDSVQSARYDVTTNTWSVPVDISPKEENSYSQQVAVDSDGNATVVWTRSGYFDEGIYVPKAIQSVLYDVTTNTWSAPVNLNTDIEMVGPSVAVDGSGNATVVWTRLNEGYGRPGTIQSARYDVKTNTWSAPVDISTSGDVVRDPVVAVDGAGNATVVWMRSNEGPSPPSIIQSARYDVTTNTWSAPVDISKIGGESYFPQVAVDGDGNATVVWKRSGYFDDEGAIVPSAIQSVRYDVTTNTWSNTADLIISTGIKGSNDEPRVVVDRDGNATAVWRKFYETGSLDCILQSSTFTLSADDHCDPSAYRVNNLDLTTGSLHIRSQTNLTVANSVHVGAGAGLTLGAPRISFEPGFSIALGGQLSAIAGPVTCPATTSLRRNASVSAADSASGALAQQPPFLYASAHALPEWVQAQLSALDINLDSIATSLLDTDGNWLVLETIQSLLISDANGLSDLYRLDLLSDQIQLISATEQGQAGNGPSRYPAADATGERIVFHSEADDLVVFDTNQVSDIFVRDIALGQTTKLTHAEQASANPALNADGNALVFDQTNDEAQRQVFGQALASGSIAERLSLHTDTDGIRIDAHHPAISGDGRFIAYLEHQVMSQDETNCQVHLYDRETEVYHRQPCPGKLATAGETLRPAFSPNADLLYWHLPKQAEPVMLTNPLAERGATERNVTRSK